jgi:TrmH family RNA methyltransferase
MKKKELRKYVQNLGPINPIAENFKNFSLAIILVNPETGGNVGSIARLMKNFEFNHLILFNPICQYNTNEAHGFAMHGSDVLDCAEIIKTESNEELTGLKTLFQQFDLVLGTSAKGVDFKNIKRIPVYLDEFDFSSLSQYTRVALVFGKESTGLTNEQIILTDFILRIPASESYSTLNLSHAAGIILYRFYTQIHRITKGLNFPASKEDKDRLLQKIESIATQIPLCAQKLDLTRDAFKNIIGRSFMKKRTYFIIWIF